MNKVWHLMSRLFYRMAVRSRRGKAIRDKDGLSVRQRAFSYFYQGLRPSQLPDMGVPRSTIYRYYQAWKNRFKEAEFRILKKSVQTDASSISYMANSIGITQEQLLEALKGCRNVTQFWRRLGIEKDHQLDN